MESPTSPTRSQLRTARDEMEGNNLIKLPTTAELHARKEQLNIMIESLSSEIDKKNILLDAKAEDSNPFSGSSFKWSSQFTTTNGRSESIAKMDKTQSLAKNLACDGTKWLHKEKRGFAVGPYISSFDVSQNKLPLRIREVEKEKK